MAKKIKDLAVKTGTYTNNYGEEKGRYMNVGAVMEGDDGGMFIMLNRYIDYGMLPTKNGESLLISAFDPKEPGQQRSSGNGSQGAARQPEDDLDDSVPF